MSVGLGTAVGYLSLDSSGFASGIDSAINDMQRLEGSSQSISGALTTVGSALTKVGGFLTAGITAPIVAATAASVKFGAEFDSQMSSVKAVSGATTQEFDKMREAAIKWGEKTVYTATEAGEALYYMSLAGWDTEAAIGGLGPVLNLAAAGNLDLGRTSDIVTDAMTALKLSAGEYTDGVENTVHFTNALSAVMSNANTDVDKLGESFKFVAPVAGTLGFSVNDLSLALGLMANVGVKSSQAGTGLRQALSGLTKPTDNARALMERYGVSLYDANGKSKSLRQVMLELRETFGDVGTNAKKVNNFIEDLGFDLDTVEGQTAATSAVMQAFGHELPVNDMEKLNAIVEIFGIRALPGILGIIEQSDDAFNELAAAIDGSDAAFVKHEGSIYTMQEALEEFGDAVYNDDSFEILGAAAGMAEIQMDNLKGDWTKLTSALGTSQIIISDMVKGVLRDFVQKLIELVQWFNNLNDGQREQVMRLVALAAAIGPVLLIIGKLITTAVRMYNTFMQLKAAFTVISGILSGPLIIAIVAIVSAIAVLVGAFVTLWNTNEQFRAKITEIWEGIKAKFEEAGQRIVDIVNKLGFDFESFGELVSFVIEVIKKAWQGFCEFLAPIFTGAFEIVATIIGGIVDLVVGIIEIIVGIIKGFKDGDWSTLWQGVGDVVTAVVETVIGILDTLGETIWNVIQTVAGWFGADWSMTWEEAKQAVVEWFATVVAKVLGFVEKITEFFTNIWTVITTICGFIWDVIKTVWDGISSTISDVLSIIWETVSSVFKTIWETISSVMQTIWNTIQTVWNIISSTVITVVTTIWNTIKTVFTEILQIITTIVVGIKDVIEKIFKAISAFLHGDTEAAKEYLSQAWETIKNLIKSVLEHLKTIFTTIWEAIQTVVTTVVNAIAAIISTVWNAILTVITTILKGIKTIVTTVWNAILKVITTVVNGVKTTVSNVFNKIKSVITTVVTAVKEKVVSVFTSIKERIVSIITNIRDKVKEIFEKIKSFITDPLGKAKDKAKTEMQDTKSGMVGAFDGVETDFKSIGTNVIQGIINGIGEKIKDLYSKIKESMAGMVSNAKSELGIKSPSTVFRDSVGQWIPLGIAEGVKSSMSDANDAIQTAVTNSVQLSGQAMVKATEEVTTAYADKVGSDLADKLAANIEKQNAKNKVTGAEAAQVLVDAAEEKWETYSKNHKTTLSDEVAFWSSIVDSCKKGTDAYSKALDNYNNANEKLQDSVASLRDSFNESWAKVQENLVSDIQGVMDKYQSTLESSVDKIKSSLGSMFSAYEIEQTEDTKELLTQNLKSQIDALNEWDKQVSTLASRSGVTDAFLEEIEALGIGATEQLKLLNSMSEDELNEFLALWDEKNQRAKEVAEAQLASYEKECEEQIAILVTEANKELKELEKTYNTELKALGVTVSDQSEAIGQNIVQGIKSGVQEYEGQLFSYVQLMCSRIVSTAQNALKIKSPSRVFADKIGKWLPPGIAEGFEEAMPSALDTIEDSLNKGINDIDVEDNGIDVEVNDFADTYKQVFEDLVIWFETMEDRMAVAIKGLTDYFKYLMQVRQTIGSDEGFKSFISGENNNRYKEKTAKEDTSSTSTDTGGDVFNFYSPKAINEVQAARLLRNTKRNLAEGF